MDFAFPGGPDMEPTSQQTQGGINAMQMSSEVMKLKKRSLFSLRSPDGR